MHRHAEMELPFENFVNGFFKREDRFLCCKFAQSSWKSESRQKILWKAEVLQQNRFIFEACAYQKNLTSNIVGNFVIQVDTSGARLLETLPVPFLEFSDGTVFEIHHT